jgi:hypothetical protein
LKDFWNESLEFLFPKEDCGMNKQAHARGKDLLARLIILCLLALFVLAFELLGRRGFAFLEGWLVLCVVVTVLYLDVHIRKPRYIVTDAIMLLFLGAISGGLDLGLLPFKAYVYIPVVLFYALVGVRLIIGLVSVKDANPTRTGE